MIKRSPNRRRLKYQKIHENVIKVDFQPTNAEEVVEKYLKDNSYESVEEWALDSDYVYDCQEKLWLDADGNQVDIFETLFWIIDCTWEN